MVEDPAGLEVPTITIVGQTDEYLGGMRVHTRDHPEDLLPALKVFRRLQRHPWSRLLEAMCKALEVLKLCIGPSSCKP